MIQFVVRFTECTEEKNLWCSIDCKKLPNFVKSNWNRRLNQLPMAIPIKVVPVLKGKAARDFILKADAALAKQGTIDFSKQVSIANKILEKAKMK